MTANNGYVTLQELKSSLGIAGEDTQDDSALSSVIERASRAVDGYCGRFFYPLRTVNYFDTPTSRSLDMGLYDCLEIVTITNGDAGAMATTEYRTVPYNETPFFRIQLKPSSGYTWESDSDSNPEGAIGVDAVWGYRQNYTREAWSNVTTLSADLASDSSTASTTGELLFAAGDVVKIDTEMMLVTACDTTGTTLTRAYNGTTAAAHTSAAVIYRFNHDPVVEQATLLQSVRLYKRKDAPFGVAGAGALGQVVAISDLDPDVRNMLFPVRRLF